MGDGTRDCWDGPASGGEALDEYVPAPARDGGGGDGADDFALPESDGNAEPVYTVGNPSETVTVTAHLSGRIKHIELAAETVHMSEPELAEEIQVVADLARQKARSELHAFIVEGLRVLGYDPAIMRDSLIRELDMPTPEQAAAAAAAVFATRYIADHD